MQLAQVYRAQGEELQVQISDQTGSRWVEVLPIAMRLSTTRNVHEGLGHCGHDKTVHALQTKYWWPHLKATVSQVLASCPMC